MPCKINIQTQYTHSGILYISDTQIPTLLTVALWPSSTHMNPVRHQVLADYLLAAVHMHWPYGEEEVLERVLKSVKPRGGLALVTGIEPYDLVFENSAPGSGGSMVREVESLGDAAALLAGRRSYRELPLQWLLGQVERSRLGFTVVAKRDFVMSLSPDYMQSQLDFARDEARHVADVELRKALEARASRLRAQASQLSARPQARSYAVVLRRE